MNYDFQYHLNTTSPKIRAVVTALREKMLKLPSTEEKLGQESGISYRTTRKSFARFEFKKTYVILMLLDNNYPEDTEKIVVDVSKKDWGYQGMIKLTLKTDVEYVFKLVEASYNLAL